MASEMKPSHLTDLLDCLKKECAATGVYLGEVKEEGEGKRHIESVHNFQAVRYLNHMIIIWLLVHISNVPLDQCSIFRYEMSTMVPVPVPRPPGDFPYTNLARNRDVDFLFTNCSIAVAIDRLI